LDLEHYQTLESVRDQYVDAGLVPRTSKFYRRGRTKKGQTTVGLSCVVAELPQPGQYFVSIVYDNNVYPYQLNNRTLTAKQRQNGVVATNTQGSGNRVRARDLFK
jgi:ABC-type iron transport system FetAB ATPase subunit